MKMIPMLFSTPMVKAILKGTKTETRRTKGLEKINENPDNYKIIYSNSEIHFGNKIFPEIIKIQPKINVGDIIWVRETFFDTTNFKAAPLFQNSEKYIYKADESFIGCNKWKPSLFMPKAAARIFLKIKSVTVERLQDITEADAINEGIDSFFSEFHGRTLYKKYTNDKNEYWKYSGEYPFESSKLSFFSLWESINGKESININPWVWVIEFEKVEKPEQFQLS